MGLKALIHVYFLLTASMANNKYLVYLYVAYALCLVIIVYTVP